MANTLDHYSAVLHSGRGTQTFDACGKAQPPNRDVHVTAGGARGLRVLLHKFQYLLFLFGCINTC